MNKLKKQIEQKEKELKILKEKLENESLKTFKCKELNLEITPVKEWTKPYNEIVIPKGWRLLKTHECIFLIEEGYKNELIRKLKEYNWIWVQQTNYAKENNYSSGVYFCRSGNVGSYYVGYLRNSDDDGRVAFCRELDVLNVKGDVN